MSFHDARAGCMGKVRYSTKHRAKSALKKMRPKMFRCHWRKFVKPDPQEAYYCECCKGWHTGTKL